MPLDYNIAFKAGDGVPAVATRTSLLKDSLGLDIETAKLDAITREAAQDAGIQAIFKNAKDPEEALKQVQMSYPHEWGAMRKDLDAHYENVWTEQVKKDNHAIATTKFIGESARAVTDEASFNVFEYVTRDLRQKMGIPLSPWDAGGRETVATLSHYGETSTDRLNAQRERHQSYLTDQLKEAGVLGEFASAENQVDWNQAHAHAGELGFGTHFTESMGMVYDANSVVRARRQWDLARQKTSTQSDVKVGSLEDYISRKFGQNPTPEQILAANKEFKPTTLSGMNALYSDIDPVAIADAIEAGDQSPIITDLGRPAAAAVSSELARRGFSLARKQSEWKSIQRFYLSKQSTQQLRIRQSADVILQSTDAIDALAKQWAAGGFKTLNKAELIAAKNGLLGPEAAKIATLLEAQLTETVEAMGNVYMGGNTPTDRAMMLAQQQLKTEWSLPVLLAATDLVRRNTKFRLNAIDNIGPSGVDPNSPYLLPKVGPEAASAATTGPAAPKVWDMKSAPELGMRHTAPNGMKLVFNGQVWIADTGK